jgi:hypothetical protein
MSPSKTDLGPGTSKQMVLLTTTEGSHQGILPMDINGHGTLKVHNGSFRCPVDVGLHTSWNGITQNVFSSPPRLHED